MSRASQTRLASQQIGGVNGPARRAIKVEIAPLDYLATTSVVAGPGGSMIEQKQVMRDYHIVALCNDGSIWRFGVNGAAGWTRMPDVPATDFPDTVSRTSSGSAALAAD